jgi:putative Flp pilus-assembly TadE/G-like protein
MAFSSVARILRCLRKDERGAVSITMGIMMIPLVGFLALGFEVSNWYMITRSMQNAADAATLAAAINNSANYDVEARAVAAQYGFTNGVNNVTIGVSNTATCPATGTKNCYSVTVSGYTPLLMSQIVGFQGAGNISGQLQKQLSALAVAQPSQKDDPLCILALAGSHTTPAIRTNGAPTGNMNGCDSMSNTAADCNGHDLGLGISFAVGSNSGCGAKQMHNDALADPYSGLVINIPPWNSPGFCLGNPPYPQETHQGNHWSGGTARSGPINLPAGNTIWCGDQLLTGDVTITAPASGAVLIIENGQLDLNGYTFQTANGSALTLVFSGDPTNATYTHAPTDNTNGNTGVLNITAPTTGPWAGVAIYQDPRLTTGVDVSAAGNSPTWNITGLIYMPHASVTLKGAIDKSTNGHKCVVLVADNFQISGTGGILKTDIGECAAAGLIQPTAKIPGAAKLVL